GFLRRTLIRLDLDGIVHLMPRVPPSTDLEVGCAAGDALAKLRLRGWEAHGIEPSPRAAEVAASRGFPVHCGPLETAPDPDRKFGLVLAANVVEHLHDPVAALARVRRWVT